MLSRTQADFDALRRPHRRHAEVTLYYPSGSQGVLPVEEGSLTFSLTTAQGNRSGRIKVPGYDMFEKVRPRNSSYVGIKISIDSSVFNLGTFPIMKATVDRPGGEVEITLGDWAYRRAQPHAEGTLALGTGMTVKQVCQDYMSHVSPGNTYTITRDDSNGAAAVPYDLRLGGNVWTGLQSICNFADCILITTGRNTGEIRRYDPHQPYMEDMTGTIVREQLGEHADELVNYVIFQMESSDPAANPKSYIGTQKLTSGPYAYNQDLLGEMAYVEHETVPSISQAAANAAALRVFNRRAGIVLAQSIDCVPTPWLSIGDQVAWTPSWATAPSYGLIESMTFPLTVQGTSRITLRDSTVV